MISSNRSAGAGVGPRVAGKDNDSGEERARGSADKDRGSQAAVAGGTVELVKCGAGTTSGGFSLPKAAASSHHDGGGTGMPCLWPGLLPKKTTPKL